jgi:hypothetical protein
MIQLLREIILSLHPRKVLIKVVSKPFYTAEKINQAVSQKYLEQIDGIS